MIEVIERGEGHVNVYFNFDVEERCVCEGDGCGDIIYSFPSREKADGFARELMLGEMLPLLRHWNRECGCGELYDDSCTHTQLTGRWQVWD